MGRLALGGLWLIWYVQRLELEKLDDGIEAWHQNIDQYTNAIKRLIINNPVLNYPCQDSQAIDISMTVLLLAIAPNNLHYLNVWLSNIVNGTSYLLSSNGHYPCTLNNYHKLLGHPKDEQGYKEQVTQGSILYPYLSAFTALFGFNDMYKKIQELKKKQLSHCNFQLWFPDATSEEHYYADTDMHGATLCNVPIYKNQSSFLDLIFKECKETNDFEKLSAIEQDFWPIILTASRHYRLPVPIQFFKKF